MTAVTEAGLLAALAAAGMPAAVVAVVAVVAGAPTDLGPCDCCCSNICCCPERARYRLTHDVSITTRFPPYCHTCTNPPEPCPEEWTIVPAPPAGLLGPCGNTLMGEAVETRLRSQAYPYPCEWTRTKWFTVGVTLDRDNIYAGVAWRFQAPGRVNNGAAVYHVAARPRPAGAPCCSLDVTFGPADWTSYLVWDGDPTGRPVPPDVYHCTPLGDPDPCRKPTVRLTAQCPNDEPPAGEPAPVPAVPDATAPVLVVAGDAPGTAPAPPCDGCGGFAGTDQRRAAVFGVSLPLATKCQHLGDRLEVLAGCASGYGCRHDCRNADPAVLDAHLGGNPVMIPANDCGPGVCPGYRPSPYPWSG